MTFGEFIREKRERKNLTIRSLAWEMGCSSTYIADIESGKRKPFASNSKLERLAEVLNLTQSEKETMNDMVGLERKETAPDIMKYMKTHPWVIQGIRRSMRSNAEREEWDNFLQVKDI